jgi:uncharacterized membrane protein
MDDAERCFDARCNGLRRLVAGVLLAERHKRQRTVRFPLGYVAVAWIYGKLVKNSVPILLEQGQKNIIPAHSRDGKLEKQQTAK